MTGQEQIIEDLDLSQSIPEAFFRIAGESIDGIVASQAIAREGEDSRSPRDHASFSYSGTAERVQSLASYLLELGVKKGDRVGILSCSRPEWMEADLAILSVGAISVSVYQTLPVDDVGYILFDSGVKVVFLENEEQLKKLQELSSKPISIPQTEEREGSTEQLSFEKYITFEETDGDPLAVTYESIVSEKPAEFIDSYKTLTRDDIASLVYTSGTTGPPKGVIQTHGNHLSNVRQAWQAEICRDDSKLMLFLPLAHSFARLMGYLGYLTSASVHFPAITNPRSSRLDPSSVSKDIREADADIIPIVPRLLEKMAAGISERSRGGGFQAKLLQLTLWSAREMSAAKQAGKAPSLIVQMVYDGMDILRKKIRRMLFGDRFAYAISGGAKLNPRTAYFFDSLNMEILEGYGLTETCVATNVNRSGANKIGTVGPVLAPDIELRIAEDQEILFRGPNITSGYYHRDAATKSSWDDGGWFHTGDLGSVDDEGYLSIVGRKKEILVSSYGKNIAPEPIEAELRSLPYVSQALLIGDGRPFCLAVLTPDIPQLVPWCLQQGMKGDFQDIYNDSRIYDLLWSEVEKVNAELPRHEKIRKLLILPEDFSVDNNLMTPTFKVKRKAVLTRYADELEKLYEE